MEKKKTIDLSKIVDMNITFRSLARGWYRCVQTLERVRAPKKYALMIARMLQGQIREVRRRSSVVEHVVLPASKGESVANMRANIAMAATAGKWDDLARERPEFMLRWIPRFTSDVVCPHCYTRQAVAPGLVSCVASYCRKEFIAVKEPH